MEYCVCGHRLGEHLGWEGEPSGCAHSIEIAHGSMDCGCVEFKLDNLSYIEYLAKQKGLI